jgi:hypothetical protein
MWFGFQVLLYFDSLILTLVWRLNVLLGVIGNNEKIKKHLKHNILPVIEELPCMSQFLLRL